MVKLFVTNFARTLFYAKTIGEHLLKGGACVSADSAFDHIVFYRLTAFCRRHIFVKADLY